MKKDTAGLISHLRELLYGVAVVNVDGMMGPARILFATVRKKEVKGESRSLNLRSAYQRPVSRDNKYYRCRI